VAKNLELLTKVEVEGLKPLKSFSKSSSESIDLKKNKEQGITIRKNSLSVVDSDTYEVKLRIHYITTIDEDLYILGNIVELGSWKEMTCKMEHKGNYVWEAKLLLRNYIKTFSYKFVCVNKITENWRWELTNNRIFNRPKEDYIIDSVWECIYN